MGDYLDQNGRYSPPGFAAGSPIGARNPFGVQDYHMGVDYPGPIGTPVPAAAGGTVYATGTQPGVGFGNFVVVQSTDVNGRAYYSIYAHLSEISVTSQDDIGPGENIGYSGNTGYPPNGYGPHLHFEVFSDVVTGTKNPNGETLSGGDDISSLGIIAKRPQYNFDPSQINFNAGPYSSGAQTLDSRFGISTTGNPRLDITKHLNDPHCFHAGTLILMGDGSQKPIEKIESGDVDCATKFPSNLDLSRVRLEGTYASCAE